MEIKIKTTILQLVTVTAIIMTIITMQIIKSIITISMSITIIIIIKIMTKIMIKHNNLIVISSPRILFACMTFVHS